MSIEKWEHYVTKLKKMEKEAEEKLVRMEKATQSGDSDSAAHKASWEEHLNKVRGKITGCERMIEEFKEKEKEIRSAQLERKNAIESTGRDEPLAKKSKIDENNNDTIDDSTRAAKPAKQDGVKTAASNTPVSTPNETIDKSIICTISWLSHIESRLQNESPNINYIKTLRDVNINIHSHYCYHLN